MIAQDCSYKDFRENRATLGIQLQSFLIKSTSFSPLNSQWSHVATIACHSFAWESLKLITTITCIEACVYRKKTKKGRLLHYQRHVDSKYKRSLLKCLWSKNQIMLIWNYEVFHSTGISWRLSCVPDDYLKHCCFTGVPCGKPIRWILSSDFTWSELRIRHFLSY